MYLSASHSAAKPARRSEGLVLVLAGPAGRQKTAQAEFLKRRYALRTITADDLTRETAGGRGRGFLLEDYPAGQPPARWLSGLAKQRDLPAPVFIEIADQHLKGAPLDVDLIQSYYPDADIWTLDGTLPAEAISATLATLLDGAAANFDGDQFLGASRSASGRRR